MVCGECNGDVGVKLDCRYKGGSFNTGMRNRAAYVMAFVYADAAQTVEFQMGSDDGAAAWLDCVLVPKDNEKPFEDLKHCTA